MHFKNRNALTIFDGKVVEMIFARLYIRACKTRGDALTVSARPLQTLTTGAVNDLPINRVLAFGPQGAILSNELGVYWFNIIP